MKNNRTLFFIILSAIMLVGLLGIQINWLLNTVQVKEELFNEKANMVLSRTVQELCADKNVCSNIGNSCIENDDAACPLKLDKADANKIDSLLRHFMSFYNFHIDYKFGVGYEGKSIQKNQKDEWSNSVFKKRLEEVASKYGLELELTFPKKEKFIMAEMSISFLSSVFLILILFILFIKTIRNLLRDKQISEHANEYLNNMTHEFKTPLTNIALSGKMIIKDIAASKTDKLKQYSEIIINENEKLRLQVEQVLNMTALERGEIPLTFTEIDFNIVVAAALKSVSVQIENKQGILKTNLTATNPIVLGDKMHLTNVVYNLFDNAIKYSHDAPEIEIATSNANNEIVFKITDNGIGIDIAQQQKIFEKYYRVTNGHVHDVKGFGLGLSYIKKVVELHHGRITVESALNKGTTFIITLPL